MSKKVELEQEPCFVLHRKFYDDDSVWLDCLTNNHGRVSIFARGARRPHSVFGQALIPFQPLLVNASGSGLLRLISVEYVRILPFLTDRRSWVALYVNELIMRLFPREYSCPDLFSLYCDTLEEIAQEDSDFFDAILRRFEIALLDILGYSLIFCVSGDIGGEIVPSNFYTYAIGSGFLSCTSDFLSGVVLSGQSLIDLSNGIVSIGNAYEVRNLMRHIIDYHLDGYALKTRKMLQILVKR
ncbi:MULTISPECIES: DNA repair protein RecO [Candidatus Ichthyocystis]|uniref:DNA repair protein RecO n=1 Tax=Candidatus Ichthyocystis hellenicum TaxID=1561003 RepID=A0A0S4M1E4_9BURK|nr:MULTISPECIES: DNA repair protein RecO [Ichthyocystis]CUT17603.1 putative DNA repair protein RecO [Candidatus Ichthyocystis hellenicum]